MAKMECGTILRSTRLLERMVTTSCFAASVGMTGPHCLVRAFATVTAASRIVSKNRGNVVLTPERKKRPNRKTTKAWAWVWVV